MVFAAEILRNKENFESVKRVAYEIGFKQLSHFSRNFKQRHGLPPTTFIARSEVRDH